MTMQCKQVDIGDKCVECLTEKEKQLMEVNNA